MAFDVVAGTDVAVSAALPATYNAAGYAALAWTSCGEVNKVPDVVGREYNTVTNADVKKSQQVEKKSSYKLGSAEMEVAWDKNDAGQVILLAASLNTSVISIRMTKANGELRYLTAQVKSFVETQGGIDEKVMGKCSFLRQTETILA